MKDHRLPLAASSLAAMLALCTAAAGGDCIDYGDYLHWISTLWLPSTAGDAAVDGSHVYVAAGFGGFLVIDVSDSTHPAIVGDVPLPDVAASVEVAAPYAFVACGDLSFRTGSLAVVDIGDPAHPTLVGSVQTPGFATGLALEGAFALVSQSDSDYSGLQIIDITDPASPSPLGSVDLPLLPRDVDVGPVGHYAFVANEAAGLQVVDFSNPATPAVAGSVMTTGYALGVAVDGNYAYVAADDAGLDVIDISNPTSPAIIGRLDPPNGDSAEAVAVAGDRAYVAAGGEVLVIDVSAPVSPVLTGTVRAPTLALGLAVAGTRAYVSGGTGGGYLQVIDISNPASPPRVGHAALSYAMDVALAGVFAYVGGGGFSVVDLSNPGSPVVRGELTSISPRGVTVSGSYVYAADTITGLNIIDASDPDGPLIVGSVDTPGAAFDVSVSGSHACVADYHHGLEVIDIADPSMPVIVGRVDTPGLATDVVVVGQHAYVADDMAGLQVIDISTPGSPVIVGSLDTVDAEDVVVVGTYAYVPDAAALLVVDVSDPASPALVRSLDLPGARAVAVAGGRAYVAAADLVVVDLSDPDTPFAIGNWNGAGVAEGVAADVGYVYVADGTGGLDVLPVQCGTPNAIEIAGFAAEAGPEFILLTWQSANPDLVGFRLQRAQLPAGSYMQLTRNPIEPAVVCTYRDSAVEPGATYGYRLEAQDRSGESAFFGPVTARLARRGTASPERRTLALSRPNPGQNHVMIDFELDRPGPARLRVLDASGRQLRVLLDARIAAGSHSALWDGRDELGRQAPAGLYFYRLETGGTARTGRCVLLK